MSSPIKTPQNLNSSDQTSSHIAVPQSRPDNPRRDYNDSDVIHHVYFEDNDSFFPPSWLGQTDDKSERRDSSGSNTTEGLREEGPPQRPAEKEHVD